MTIEKVKDNYNKDVRLALLEQSILNINNTLLRIEKRFDQMDSKFDKIDSKFDKIDSKFDKVDSKFDSKFDQLLTETRSHHKWNFGLIGGLYIMYAGTLSAILVKFIHS